MSQTLRSRDTSGWKIFRAPELDPDELMAQLSAATAESVMTLPEPLVLQGVLFGLLPPEELYEEAGTRFGATVASFDDSAEYAVYKELLNSEMEEPELRSLVSAIWETRQAYHGTTVAQAETFLLRLVKQFYVKMLLEKAVEAQNLPDLYQSICYAQQLSMEDEVLSEARMHMARLEQMAHEISKAAQPEHNERYNLVIGELSEKLFGANVAELQEAASTLAAQLVLSGKEDYDRIIALDKRLDALKQMASSSSKANGLEEVLTELKALDVTNAKETLQTTKAELKAKLRQLAVLTTKVKQLEKKSTRVDEVEKLLIQKNQEQEDLEAEKALLLEKVDNIDQEKETVREETMEFAHKYLKDEFKKRSAAQREELEGQFSIKLQQALKDKEDELRTVHLQQVGDCEKSMKTLEQRVNDLIGTINQQQAQISTLKENETKMKQKLSEYKARQRLGG